MAELFSLNPAPLAPPPTATDVVPIGRLPPNTAPPGTATPGYTVPLGSLAPAILPKAFVVASGTAQGDAAAFSAWTAIVVGGIVGSGVRLQSWPQSTQTVLNRSGVDILVYPPSAPGGAINGLGAGLPVLVHSGVEAAFHTGDDGVSFFVAQ